MVRGPTLIGSKQSAPPPGQTGFYAAGGVRDAHDLMMLAQAGINGALVASCLHDGGVTKQDLAALSKAG